MRGGRYAFSGQRLFEPNHRSRPMANMCYHRLRSVGGTGCLACLTPAHTRIENRRGYVCGDGQIRTTWSDWVAVIVHQVAGVEIRPLSEGTGPADPAFKPASEHMAQAGRPVIVPYRLHNLGNGADIFDLEVHVMPARDDAPDLLEVALVYDQNENGVIDGFERSVEEIRLTQNHNVSLLLHFRVPYTVSHGDVYYVSVAAKSRFDPAVRFDATWSVVEVHFDEPLLYVHRLVELIAGTFPNAPVELPGLSAGQGATMRHTIVIENVSETQATGLLVIEPIDPSEKLHFVDQGFPIFVAGVPMYVPVDSTEGTLRFRTDWDGRTYLEIDLGQIAPFQTITIEFETEVDWREDQRIIRKAGEVSYALQSGARRTVYTNEIVVHYELHYDLNLYPSGRPPLPGQRYEHRRTRVYASEKAVFATTVGNTGTMAGTIEVRQALSVPEAWNVVFVADDGETPLEPGSREGWFEVGYFLPGEQRDVMLIIEVPEDEAYYTNKQYDFLIEAAFQERTDAVATLPVYIEGVYPIEYLWDPLRLDVDLDGVAIPGIELTYMLYFRNASEVDAGYVTVTNYLSEHLDFIEVAGMSIIVGPPRENPEPPVEEPEPHALRMVPQTAASPMQSVPKVVDLRYDPDQHALVWVIENFSTGSSAELQYRTRVREHVRPCAVIAVMSTLQSDLTYVVAVSNVVTNIVLPSELVVTLTTDQPVVALGDVSTYDVDVVNLNPLSDLENIDVVVQLPPGLTYRPATSRLDGTPIPDPAINAGELHYRIPYLAVGGRARLTFKTTVNAAAENELYTYAQASIVRSSGQRIYSETARVRVFVLRGIFADEGVILGRILLTDGSPVPDVRVVLDNGRYAVSDANGYFAFSGLKPGPWVLRLDPTTLAGKVEADAGGRDASLVRVVVPAGGIATAQFTLTPARIQIRTGESILEEGIW